MKTSPPGRGSLKLIGRLLLLALIAACLDFGNERVFTQEGLPPAIRKAGADPRHRLPAAGGRSIPGLAPGSLDRQSLLALEKESVSPAEASAISALLQQKRMEESAAAEVKPPAEAEPGEKKQSLSFSVFERQLESYSDPLLKRPILQFGYEVFSRPQQPLLDAPVCKDYVLGTGDSLVISLWGNVDQDYRAEIDRDGQIRLPLVGPVPLRGLTIERAEAVLKQKFDRQFVDYQLQLRLGRLRDMTVHVIGRVVSPGRIRVPSVATLLDALAGAGGITKDGTLRKVLLRRAGEPDRQIDLYSYILKGDLSVDIGLAPNDAIVVPAVGSLAAVVGRVQHPAIYELEGGAVPLDSLLAMAGGYARLANRSRVQIESVSDTGLSIRSVDLEATAPGKVILRDGEVAVIESANPKLEDVVYVTGNVSLPGRYAFREGMRVSDLINQDTLMEAGFWFERSSPGASRPDAPFPEPFLDYALIRRLHPQTQQESRIAFHLGKAILEHDPAEDHLLQSQDTIVIFPRSRFEEPRSVFITGAVNKPGNLVYFPGMRVRDLVRMAGGLLPEAYLESAILTRILPEQEGTRYEHITVDIRGAMAGDESANLLLEHSDSLAIKTVPEFHRPLRVDVEGEVRHPGTYLVIPGERLSNLLQRAGGYTADAYLPAAQFYRESVRKLQQERLEESLRRLETETQVAAQQFAAEASALSEEEGVDVKSEQNRIERLINVIRDSKAKGRVVIRLVAPEKLAGTPDDLELVEGDRLVIPRRPEEVHVVGAVFNQNALIHYSSLTARDYLQECGGALDTADMDVAYIIRADGTADSAESARRNYRWDGSRGSFSRGSLFASELYPGDTLVIPYDVQPKLSKLGLTKTIIQMLFQTALTTGVIVALI